MKNLHTSFLAYFTVSERSQKYLRSNIQEQATRKNRIKSRNLKLFLWETSSKSFLNWERAQKILAIFFSSRPWQITNIWARISQNIYQRRLYFCFYWLTTSNLLTTWRFVLWPFFDSFISFCHPFFNSYLIRF